MTSNLVLALLLAGLLSEPQFNWPTVAEVVTKLGTDAAGLPANVAGMRLAGYDTLADGGVFAFAGYEFNGYEADGSTPLDAPLYVALRERGAPWRWAAIGENGRDQHFGSITDLSLAGNLLLVGVHVTPSASQMIVLKKDLTVLRRLNGWFLTWLPNGLIVFHRSMIHFAPAHPGELATFDVERGVEMQLYPGDEPGPERRAFIERLRPIFRRWEKQDRERDQICVYGYDPEWFHVTFGDMTYDLKTDTLTVAVNFKFHFPEEIAPSQTADLIVTCRPMLSPSRGCTESRPPE